MNFVAKVDILYGIYDQNFELSQNRDLLPHTNPGDSGFRLFITVGRQYTDLEIFE